MVMGYYYITQSYCMLSIMYYALQVVLCSALLMGYYWLVLRNKRFHQYNRFYLLAVVFLSWIVPLIKIRWVHSVISTDQQVARFLSVVADGNTQIEEIVKGRGSALSWGGVVIGVYLLVAAVLLAGIIRALFRLYRLLQTHSCKTIGDIYLVLTQAKGTPFSFFRYIFWNDEIDIRSESGKQILEHELTHVKEKHSVDKLFIQLVLVAGWFNPFFWLLKREMEMIHEFIADKKAVANGDVASLAEMLLTTIFPQQKYYLTHPFFFSPVKRRLQMLTNTSHPRFTYIRRLIVLPLLAVLVVLFSFRNKESRKITLSLATVVDHVIDNPSASLILDHVDNLLSKPVTGNRDSVRIFADSILVHGANGFMQKAYGNITIADKGQTGLLGEALVVVNGKKSDISVLQTIDPDDVSRIDILKDQLAVNSYGDAGKNGVVLVTTKNKNNQPVTDMPLGNYGKTILNTSTVSGLIFQSIAKDPMDNPAKNRVVYIKDQILKGSNHGEVVLEETHAVKTDADGFYSIKIGEGIKIKGFDQSKFDGIDWSSGTFFFNLKEAVSPLSTTKWWIAEDFYVDRETVQMMFMPNGLFKTSVGSGTPSTSSMPIKSGEDIYLKPNTTSKIDMAFYSARSGDKAEVEKLSQSKDWSVQSPSVKQDSIVSVDFTNYTNRIIKIVPADYRILLVRDVVLESQKQEPVEFPGGEAQWQKYLQRNKNSDMLVKNGAPPGKYSVTVSFIVDKNGMVSDVKAENDPGYGTKAEAIRLIEKGPKWKPASVNGKQVVYRAKRTIIWVIPEEDKKTTGQMQSSPAKFMDGFRDWTNFVVQHFDKEKLIRAGMPNGNYAVWVNVAIDSDGTLSNFDVTNDPGYGSKEEAIRILRNCPKWMPAVRTGKKVASSKLVAVPFFIGSPFENMVHKDKREYYYFGWSRPMGAVSGNKQIILFTGIKKGAFTSDEVRQKANEWGDYATKKRDPHNNFCTSDLNTYPSYQVAQKVLESFKNDYTDPDKYIIQTVSF